MAKIGHIGVFTSGGDSPGMNACIRAVVRTGVYHGCKVTGFRYGYNGVIENDSMELTASSVANIIQRGGTMLKTARSKAFFELPGRKKAAETLKKSGVDALVAIGGDGTFRGCIALHELLPLPVIGCPGTIDNDLAGTDFTIGYDTAINTVVDSIDKIRDTAESHNRVFFVEVMGRDAGLIAMRAGIGGGAEAILMPETGTDIEELVKMLKSGRQNKSSKIILVAEGDEAGGAISISEKIKTALPDADIRVTILGHVQRGGNPTCMDRVNASRMGYGAVTGLLEGKKGVMCGIVNGAINYIPFEKAVKHIENPNPDFVKMMKVLAS
ncbi:MAG: 6-phosphofructokinase [Flavobacteriales bacterium]